MRVLLTLLVAVVVLGAVLSAAEKQHGRYRWDDTKYASFEEAWEAREKRVRENAHNVVLDYCHMYSSEEACSTDDNCKWAPDMGECAHV